MAWFLQLEHKGQRTSTRCFESTSRSPSIYVNEKVRGEVLRHFGYFMTESTGHLSEYLPWFRKSPARPCELYCDEPAFGGESGAYYKFGTDAGRKYQRRRLSGPRSHRTCLPRSPSTARYIIEAHRDRPPFHLQGNVRNDGYITNLPAGCCVEVPIFVDRAGLHPVSDGDLPPQCAALNQSNINVQRLAVEAAFSGDPRWSCTPSRWIRSPRRS